MDAKKPGGNNNRDGDDPMDVDPIDDGPRPTATPTPVVAEEASMATSLQTPVVLTREEEAREVIEALRTPDDVAQRVTAAHRLPAVANVLGPERTRAVRELRDTNRQTTVNPPHDERKKYIMPCGMRMSGFGTLFSPFLYLILLFLHSFWYAPGTHSLCDGWIRRRR